MNFFITTNEGRHRLTLDDFRFMQDGYLEGFDALVKSLVPEGTEACILSGCELTLGPDAPEVSGPVDGDEDITDGDLDNDGIADEQDTDEDGDGLDEAADPDDDGDGFDDSIDPDDDGDGIADSEESDLDGDGTEDETDTDDDNDGVDDSLDTDDDNDGLDDSTDADDDNDGVDDSAEPAPSGSADLKWHLTAGYIYLTGEVYFVPEQGGYRDHAGQIPCLDLAVSYLAIDPVPYGDGQSYNVHQIRELVLYFVDSANGLLEYDSLPDVADLLLERLGLSDSSQDTAQLQEDVAQLQEDVADLEQQVADLQAQLDAVADYTVPIGTIVLTDDVDEFDLASGLGISGSRWQGWALCDGQNGTNDMRSCFVVGYDDRKGSAYDATGQLSYNYGAPGNIGGEDFVQLDISQMPGHNHSDGEYDQLLKRSEADDPDRGGTAASTDTSLGEPVVTKSGTIQSEGGNGFHENRPPYIVMAYVKKVF